MENVKITQLKKASLVLWVIIASMTFTTGTFAQYVPGSGVCGTNYARQYGNNVFEIYQDYGDACIDVYRQNGRHFLTGNWSSEIGNALIRESDRSTPSVNDFIWSYMDIYTMRGNTYHGLYSWWRNDPYATNGVVEFYVVEGYNDKNHPTGGMTYRGYYYTQDPDRRGGSYYEVWTREMKNAPSVYGRMNFTQIKCVRVSRQGTEGFRGWIGVNTREHMLQARKFTGYYPHYDSNLFEISYKIEGYAANRGYSEADFLMDAYIGNSSKSLNESDRQAIHATKEYEVTIAPNPSNGVFEISTNTEDTIKEIKIFDLNGALAYSTESSDNQITINGSSLASGVYMLQTTQNGVVATDKIIIK